MDLKVPNGISFRPAGIMTVKVGRPVFLNFAWLPFWETNKKPFERRVLINCREEYNLGIAHLDTGEFRFFDLGDNKVLFIFKV